MPRLVQRPLFPDSPGRWLACFRYRWRPDGRHCSPEQLGTRLGVSGTTVRRWEAGQLRPTRADLQSFARTCELSPIEEQFLIQAFQNREVEAPPNPDVFEGFARNTLSNDQPAFIVDSLYYIRARNRFHERLSEIPVNDGPNNALMAVFGPTRPGRSWDELRRIARNFWYATAGLASHERYASLLAQLRRLEEFEAVWWDMALQPAKPDQPVNMPMTYEHPERGSYRVYMTRVVLPPTYFLREYIPVDDAAHRFMRELRESAENEVNVLSPYHWSREGGQR